MKAKLYFVLSMIIFGAVGVFAKFIELSPAQIAFYMSLIGSVLLFVFCFVTHNRIAWGILKKNALQLLLASAALSGNWIFLFQSYKETTIANAALSYYFAPVLVIAMSPFLLKEKLSRKKVICVCTAVLGLILIMRSGGSGSEGGNAVLGIGYGLIAAVFYAVLTLTHKFIRNMGGLEITFVQLVLSSVWLVPYLWMTEGTLDRGEITSRSIILLALLGILHAGVGFYLFFSGMKGLQGQSIAVLSYVDPLTSLLISAAVLGGKMTVVQGLGALLLLGSTFVSEGSRKEESLSWNRLFRRRLK